MFESEITKYKALNELAEQGGSVIFGGSDDIEIPLCELKQAFSLGSNLYNRSFPEISVSCAKEIYDICIADLYPDNVLLHIGAADIKLFGENKQQFDSEYRELIAGIRKHDKKCNIVVVSLKNGSDSAVISDMNKHLRYIAETEHCEFADIGVKHIQRLRENKDVLSFVYSAGFVHPLSNKLPLYDLADVLFCCG